MLKTFGAGSVAAALALALACGGSSGSPGTPSTPAPAPAPTPTPAPIGQVAFLGASLPADSTVPVDPMNETGQQAQQLWFEAVITMDQDLPGALVRAWVRTEEERCMGGGRAGVDFQGGVAREVRPASMSSGGHCALPYTTTQLEFEVIAAGGESVLQQRFPMSYHFVAAP
jgi:hypothetical protein